MKICQSCGICCTHTEMILSSDDVQRILDYFSKKSQNIDFFEFDGRFYRLKNIDDHCVFYIPNEKKCLIYPIRPMGCRFYPMIFDQSRNKCILDDECPHNRIFYSNPSRFKAICLSLRKWIFSHILNQTRS
ncbi:MAG: YkgJ family cysteine cluster protein [Candidatus Lokiarchaeota archaeon]|nr:YkgJ family cysteine cluster protein [Candidatus Harpocratesius repetitus]